MVDPAVKPIWLANVQEMQPLPLLFIRNPAEALAFAAFPTVGIVALAILARQQIMRRDFGFLLAGAALLFGTAVMCGAIKGFSYVLWLAMPLVAAMALRLFEVMHVRRLLPRFIIGLWLTPAVLSGSIIGMADAAGLQHGDEAATDTTCFKSVSYTPFDSLKPGLVATNIDYGPFLLALTPHSVLAAPYHRLSTGIIAAHRIFASTPDEARHILARMHVDYLATCGTRGPGGARNARQQASLREQLHVGAVPDWLAREPVLPGQAFTIYRVRP